MTRRSLVLAMAIGVTLGACGGTTGVRKTRGSEPPATTASDGAMSRQDPRMKEINDRHMEIVDWRREMGLKLSPAMTAAQPLGADGGIPAPTCDAPPATPECSDTCRLADHICENASEICRIAGELEDSEWAADKCKSASASCVEAKTVCCGCA